ncbi:MAG: sulfotransferase [Cellvibrionales bacterium]|nr:sulfotransferase [Cellvibrionales bacterium]
MKIFIVGTSRSGSTLLRNILALHPKVGIFNETQWIPTLLEKFKNGLIPFAELLSVARDVTWDDGSNRIDGNINDYAEDPDHSFQVLEQLVQQNTPISVKAFVETIHQLTFGQEQSIQADKTPDYGHYMQDLQTIWPDAKFIHIVRDGVACAKSMQKHRGCRILANSGYLSWPSIAYKKAYEQFSDQRLALSYYITHWSNKLDNIRNQSLHLTKETYLEVSYDSLLNKPDKTLDGIFTFLSMDWEHEAILPSVRSMLYKTPLPDIPSKALVDLPLDVWRNIQPLSRVQNVVENIDSSDFGALPIDKQLISLLFEISHLIENDQHPKVIKPALMLGKILIEESQEQCEWLLEQLANAFFDEASFMQSMTAYLLQHTKIIWNDYSPDGVMSLTQALIKDGHFLLVFFFIGVLSHFQSRPYYYLRMMNALFRLKNDKALRFYGRLAIQCFPKNKNIKKALAYHYFHLGFLDDFDLTVRNIPLSVADVDDLRLLYRQAMTNNEFTKALEYLSCALSMEKDQPDLYVAKSEALLALGYYEKAEAVLKEAVVIFGEKDVILKRLLQLYQQHDHFVDMARVASRFYQYYPNRPIDRALANAYIQLGDTRALEETMASWEDEEQCLFRIKLSAKRKQIHQTDHLIEDYGKPVNEVLWYYLDLDEADKALRLLEQLGSSVSVNQMVNVTWRALLRQQGFDAASGFLQQHQIKAPKDPVLRIHEMDLLIQQSLYKDVVDFADHAETVLGKHRGFTIRKIKALIALEQKQEAQALIDSISDFSYDRITIMLKAWAAYASNQAEKVPAIWQKFTGNHYVPELDYQLHQLVYVSDKTITIQRHDIPLFTVLRNEMPMLPAFFDYYRKLGVTHFIIVDNDSDDGSFQWLSSQADVYLYHTRASYKSSCYGIRWINGLMNLHAQDQWAIYVDVDEYMVLPDACDQSVGALIQALGDEQSEALTGFMIDMFSKTLQEAKGFKGGDNPLDYAPYFDNAYQQTGHWHAPFVEVYGGFRKRFVWENKKRGNPLTKTPLVKVGKVQFLSSSHVITPAKVASASVGLLHFKFLGDAEDKFSEEISRNEHACINEEYQRYLDAMQATGEKDSLLVDASVHFENAGQLETLGLIRPFSKPSDIPKAVITADPKPNYDYHFYEGQYKGALRSSKKCLGHLFNHYQPRSVVDFGCGIGAWLTSAGDLGVSELHGLDGQWVNPSHLLHASIKFKPTDFTLPIKLNRRYDLAMSLEVAEHFDQKYAKPFVDSLCQASDMIIFGAAVPWQGGEGHVNEQMQSYWQRLFLDNGYACIDFFRPALWSDREIEWWYRQNTFLYVRKTHAYLDTLTTQAEAMRLPSDLIHPEFLYSRTFWDNHKRDPEFANKLMSYDNDRDIFRDLAIYFEYTNTDLADFFKEKSAQNQRQRKRILSTDIDL